VVLTGGEVSDVKGYGPVMAEPGPEPKVLMGDKGYDADAILADLEDRGIAAVIPPKRNRKVQPIIDGHLYALRNLVERCFSKLKHSRRLATRYDKTADSYIGFILIASTRLWVRHFVNRTQSGGRISSLQTLAAVGGSQCPGDNLHSPPGCAARLYVVRPHTSRERKSLDLRTMGVVGKRMQRSSRDRDSRRRCPGGKEYGSLAATIVEP
jgi:transposase